MLVDNIWSLVYEAYWADANLGAVVKAVLKANFIKQVVLHRGLHFLNVFILPKASQCFSNFVKCINIFVILFDSFPFMGLGRNRNSLLKLYSCELFKFKDHCEKYWNS